MEKFLTKTTNSSSRTSLRFARDFITAQNGTIAPLPLSEEELNPTEQDDLSIQVYPMENMNYLYPVEFKFPEDSMCSEFRYFEDGKQRTVQIGFIPVKYNDLNVLIPVHYLVVAAVILVRENRQLKVWEEAAVEESIIVEKSLVPDQSVLAEFTSNGLTVLDSSDGGSGGDYYSLKSRALRKAKERRLNLENQLIGRWRQSQAADDSFLVVDGTLMNFRNEESVERCIGVSKSFGSRYFSSSDHTRILQMAEFERSWTFRFHSEDEESDDPSLGGRDRISWYLRIRSALHADPEFGLLRVEISQRHGQRSTEFADRFSRSLLSDRLPTGYPEPRWDNHLYPIRACEKYLSSIIPSIGTINASMKG